VQFGVISFASTKRIGIGLTKNAAPCPAGLPRVAGTSPSLAFTEVAARVLSSNVRITLIKTASETFEGDPRLVSRLKQLVIAARQ
jgi:hypothetical protein